MTAPRHDCGEACACTGLGVDPKLFELEGRHGRLLAAAKAVLETKKYANPSGQWHHSWRLALYELDVAVGECEASR